MWAGDPATRRSGRVASNTRASSGHSAPTPTTPKSHMASRGAEHHDTKRPGRSEAVLQALSEQAHPRGTQQVISSRLFRTPSLPRMWAACVRTVSTPSCRACAISAWDWRTARRSCCAAAPRRGATSRSRPRKPGRSRRIELPRVRDRLPPPSGMARSERR